MGRHTEGLRSYWSVASLEEAMHQRVTVPMQPEAWLDEVQSAVAAALFAGFEVAGKHILDFGCGVGRVARPLAKLGAVVHAVDVSQAMVEYCRAYCEGAGVVHCYLCDGYSVPLPDRTIDGAYSVYVFQHMPDRDMVQSALKDLRRVAKPGAWFRLQSVDHRSLVEPAVVGMHGVRQSSTSLGKLAEAVGWKVLAIDEENGPNLDNFVITFTTR